MLLSQQIVISEAVLPSSLGVDITGGSPASKTYVLPPDECALAPTAFTALTRLVIADLGERKKGAPAKLVI